ncbi:M20/M25/M40 family metallo-hydrolase [Shinella curvata]|uniref:M20/M25/M40 family metallo-hydrolase n=1 Tax=Shinella curvata TaxID=1817964 RepID=A0ABT8X857_9HYPH|nr:M20/M25/M40 family metallo-hydrolase [Shinella curvata]MCJ8052268.1 M20/M25/M40 family metallo-hydrolase [Shinella curvata]MDO6119783.1 M20/M25/M40 family metallo-hydrolase [Shinella curvata]
MTTENAIHTAAARAKNLSLLMTRWPSVTGSPDEAAFSESLRANLAETPYFKSHPDQIFTVDSHGEPMTQNVVALVRGRGRRAVVLAGHFDTVSIANYGTLAPLACDPEPLTNALLQELRSRPLNGAETKALKDFESGDFIAGRGLLDMKSGLAAGIAALERFAGLEAPEGNILFVATPDEENRSRGMRSLRNALPEIARRFDLDIVGGINLDASSCERDGEEGRAVYLGSIGKFAPFAFVIGRPTHAGYPFNGTSAHRISAEIVRAMDTVPELSDEAFGERSPPPVCLEARDIRDGYDVTTPDRVWLSFNWLTHRRSPAEILGEFRTIVTGALNAALEAQDAHKARYRGRPATKTEGTVLTYAELLERLKARGGDALDRLAALDRSLSGGTDPLKVSREIVAAAAMEAGIEGPAIIIGFGSLHYPLVHLERAGEGVRSIQARLETVMQDTAKRHGTSIKFKQIFAGISDMSFFGHRPDAGDTGLLTANTPSAAFTDDAPDGLLSFPTVNIGPWGRDYHQKWERVHAPYTFEVLPDLVFESALAWLAE